MNCCVKKSSVFFLPFRGILFILLFSLISLGARAQSTAGDSSLANRYADSILAFYQTEIGENLHLYNGTEYLRNGSKARGFPFFESGNFAKGTVSYNGRLYRDVSMYYDLSSDQLVISNYNNNGAIALVPEKTIAFLLFNHLFVRIVPDKENAVLIKEGFYDQLYRGKVSVFAKRLKKLEASLKAEDESGYKQYNEYFLEMNHIFYKVSSESSLLDPLKDKKAELKKYIRENKLSFRKNPEETLIKTAGYYTLLTN